MNRITKQPYDPKFWDRRAIPVNDQNQPIDPENGLTLDSIDTLGHQRFHHPSKTTPSYVPPKADQSVEEDKKEEGGDHINVPQQ